MPTADTEVTDTPDNSAPDTEALPSATEQTGQDDAHAVEAVLADDGAAATGEASMQDAEAEQAESDADADALIVTDGDPVPEEVLPEPPPPLPIQLILWNEKVPASAGCWVFWRAAGFECRGKIEKGLFTATCKGHGSSTTSAPIDLLIRRRFVSQGEAIAVVGAMLSFDPQQADSLGFEITGRAMLPFLPASGAFDEEQPAVSG